MFKTYLKIAWRNLLRHKGYTLINISGLAVGMACCVLILLFVQDELSYDRYHELADRIYRLRVERFASGGETELVASAAAPMAPAIINDFPQVERAVRISQRTYLVERGNQRFYEERFFWADSALFDIFSFKLIKGNPKTALAAPYSVVLTEELAQKYFGEEEPLGQFLTIEKEQVKVTGIVQRPPSQSHFRFDLLGSFTTLEALNKKPSTEWGWWNQQYHLNIFTAITIFVACLGLFGLASFMAEQRTKEIGIRKVLGASLANLLTLLAKDFVKLVLIANLIAWPVAYYAMKMWLQDFAYHINLDWWLFALAGSLALLIALLTLSTQALKAALANPVEALRYE